MKKFKRLIALVTVAMFILSFAAPAAFAADATTDTVAKKAIGQDVVGTKYESYSKKLIGLGIINGFEDGSIKPESDVTRAQFAVIVAKMLNLGDVSPSPTKFKDVNASHWASGAINLAVGRGIIHGYPDGTFKPEQNVTYAEAAAMLMQTLGYGPALKEGKWPATPVALAASAGVTKGVALGADAKTPRGEVIMMAANAMTADIMEQDTWGTDPEWKKRDGDKTLLTEVFDIEVLDVDYNKDDTPWDDTMPSVSKTSRFNLNGLDPEEVNFVTNLTSGDYEVSPYFDPNKFMGQEVEVWVDRDDLKVYYIGQSNEETVYFDEVDSFIDPAGANPQIKLDIKDDEYDLKSTTKIYVNTSDLGTWSAVYTDTALLTDLAGAPVKAVLDDAGDVAALVFDDYYGTQDAPKSGVVKEVKDDVIYYYGKDGEETSLDLDGDDYAIVKDGAQAELSELKADDVINFFTEASDEEYIVVTGAKVSGKVEKVVTADDTKVGAYDIYVDGKKYDVAPEATFSDDANDNIDAIDQDDLEDLTDKEVTLSIDAMGDVKHVVTGDATESSQLYGVLTKPVNITGPYDEVKMTMVNKAGVEQTFEFDYDDVDLNNGEPSAKSDWVASNVYVNYSAGAVVPVFVKYELDSAGDLDEVNVQTLSDLAKATNQTINAEDDMSIDTDKGSFNITDKTVIWDASNWDATNWEIDDLKTVSWDALDDRNITAYAKTDGSEVDYLVVVKTDKTLGSGDNFGVVTGFSTVGGDDALVILTKDGSKTYVWDEADAASTVYDYIYFAPGDTAAHADKNIKKGDFVYFTLKGSGDSEEIDEIEPMAYKNHFTKLSGVNYTDVEIEKVKAAEVVTSSTSYIKGKDIADHTTGAVGAETYYTVNADTAYFEIYDTGALKKVDSVSFGDTVILIDTDDDGAAYDYVLVIK